MKKFAAVLSFIFILASCQDIVDTPKPEDLIPEEKMVEVLTDISLLYGARTYNKKLMEEMGIRPYDYLLQKHEIDSMQFRRSNNYYSENYKQYQRIYDSVKRRLEIMQVRFDSITETEKRRQDSLRALDTTSIKKMIPEDEDTLIPYKFKDRKILPDPVSEEWEVDSLN